MLLTPARRTVILRNRIPTWLRASIARMTAPPTAGDKSRLIHLSRSVPASKLDAFYRMNAETEQAGLLNLIANAYNLTKHNTLAFAAGVGFTGDGSTTALESGFIPSSANGKFTLNDASFGVNILGPGVSTGTKIDMGSQSTGTVSYVGGQNTGLALIGLNSGTADNSLAAGTAIGVLGLWSVIRRTDAAIDVYCGHLKIVTLANASSSLATSQMRILASALTYPSNRTVSHAFFGAAPTDPEMAAFAGAIHRDAKATGAYLKRAAIVCHGNSLTAGYNGQVPYTTPLQAAYDAQPLAVTVLNEGFNAYTTQQLTAQLAGARLQVASQYPADRRILVVWELRNDMVLNGLTPAQAITNLAAYCNAARAHGYDKIIVCNTIADGSGDANFTPTDQAEVNALLAANYHTFVDHLVDLAADSRFQNPADTTYYAADKLHLVSAGYAVVAELVKPVVDLAIAAPL